MTWQQAKRLSEKNWVLAVVALAFATRLHGLDTQSLWFDEIIIVTLARASWYDGLVGLLGQGIQATPMFHWVTKMALTIHDSDWWLRMPAVVVSVLAVPMAFKVGQRFFDNKVGLLAALVFAINPFQVWYGQESKLYALLPLTSAGAMLAFTQMVQTQGRRGLKPLILFNVLGFSTHYFMFLISAVQFLYILIFFRRFHSILSRWTMAQVVGVLPLLPWWLFIISQQHFAVGIGWIPRPRWFDPFLTFWNFSFTYLAEFSIGTVLALVVLSIGVCTGLWKSWRNPVQGSLLTLWLLFPPIITVLLSLNRISFYVDRYLLIVSPILTVLTAAGLLSIRSKSVRWGLVLVFLSATGWGLWQVYFDREDFSKEDWRTIAHRLDAQAQPGQVVITCIDGTWLAFEYYNPHQTLSADDVIFAAQISEVSPSDRVAWMINTHEGLPSHYLGKSQPPALDRTWLSSGAEAWEADNLKKIITVPGISAYQYDITHQEHLAEIVEWHCGN